MKAAEKKIIRGLREAEAVASGKIAPASWTMIDAPIPPSTNDLYYHNYTMTAKHRAWRKAFGQQLQISKAPTFFGPWLVEIVIPQKTKGDPSNRVKAVEDAFVEHGITPDDKIAEGSFCRRGDISFPNGGCMITVRSARAA